MDKWVRINKREWIEQRDGKIATTSHVFLCSSSCLIGVGSCMISVGCADASIGSEPVFWQVEVSYGSRLPCLFPALCPLSRARASWALVRALDVGFWRLFFHLFLAWLVDRPEHLNVRSVTLWSEDVTWQIKRQRDNHKDHLKNNSCVTSWNHVRQTAFSRPELT